MSRFNRYGLAYILLTGLSIFSTGFLQVIACILSFLLLFYLHNMITNKTRWYLLIESLIITLVLKESFYEYWLTTTILYLVSCLLMNHKNLMLLFHKTELINDQLEIIDEWQQEQNKKEKDNKSE